MKRRRTAQEQKLADDVRLMRWWSAWHREERDAVVSGPHSSVLSELFRMFKNLDSVKPAQLIGLAKSIDWNLVDYNTKLVVIHELNNAITKFREKCGLEPIDDNLPGNPETPFRAIKAIVLTPSPHCEGAHRGGARPE